MSHEQLFHGCKSARVLCRSIRLLNLTKSIFWTSLEALSSSWLYVHHQRRREVLLSSDKRVRIAYLLECCAGLVRPWSRAGAGCMEAQAGVSALQHARLRCMVGCSDGSGERVVVVGGMQEEPSLGSEAAKYTADRRSGKRLGLARFVRAEGRTPYSSRLTKQVIGRWDDLRYLSTSSQ